LAKALWKIANCVISDEEYITKFAPENCTGLIYIILTALAFTYSYFKVIKKTKVGFCCTTQNIFASDGTIFGF
jgi:hypothetical protein